MALVDHPLAVCGHASATVPIDDSQIDVDGHAFPDADLEGPFTLVMDGPGGCHIFIWRGLDGPDSGRNPWRDSLSLYPDGITAAVSPVIIASGGPVKQLDDVSWAVSYWTG